MKTLKVKKGLTGQEALEVKAFLTGQAVLAKPTKDIGSSILGNGIRAFVVRKGCRNPNYVMIFHNNWTQGEQPEALNKMLTAAKKQFPHLANFLSYDCGVMN